MNLLFFILYCTVMTATPGPTNIMILSTVHNHGVKKALQFSFGSAFAFFLLLALSVVFNSILMVYLPKIVSVLQIVGAIYMLYLAYGIFKISSQSGEKQNISSFKSGFLLQFINPKSVLFALTVFPSFVLPYYQSTLSLILFVLLISFICVLAFLSWVLFGKVLKGFLDRYSNIVNNIMAGFLVLCAAMISGIVG